MVFTSFADQDGWVVRVQRLLCKITIFCVNVLYEN